MPLWAWVLVTVAAAMFLLAAAALSLQRGLPPERRRLASGLLRLPWRDKLAVFGALLTDRRVPLWLRAVLPALALYLVLPFDIIPDFIPVVGYLDDVLVIAVAAGILLRFPPARRDRGAHRPRSALSNERPGTGNQRPDRGGARA